MSARNNEDWSKVPSSFKPGEWVDSRIYSDPRIHDEEIDKIWKRAWIPVCHESELANPYDFRTLSIANEPIILTRDKDLEVRAFLNVCPHRGNLIERRPSGNFKKGTPSGTPKKMTCMFHAWQFDMKGKCVYISRQDEGYQDRLCTAEVGLRQLKCQVYFGGFVWVCLDDNIDMDVEQWAAGALDCLAPSLNEEPLQVFHYHKAIIPCNYKLWHDTNCEFYHDYLHYHNRITGFNDAYFGRKNSGFKNGHINVGSFEVQYDKYEGFESRESLSFPHLPPNHWYMIDMFPGVNFNLRGSALRCDLMTPLSANKVMIEFRGLGLKSDTPEQRQIRIDHHNSIWGPFGRNLHEDLLAVTAQGTAMQDAADNRRVLHGRHENETIHDENGMRHFYDEWGRWLNRSPQNPDLPYSQDEQASKPVAVG